MRKTKIFKTMPNKFKNKCPTHISRGCEKTLVGAKPLVTGLDLRNDENRPSLTSGAVAEERQDVSSRNTIYG